MARVRLLHTVRPDPPLSRSDAGMIVEPGEREVAYANPLGAVFVESRDGRLIGVKPHEFEWVDEPPARAPEHTPPEERWYRARVRALEAEVKELQAEIEKMGSADGYRSDG